MYVPRIFVEHQTMNNAFFLKQLRRLITHLIIVNLLPRDP